MANFLSSNSKASQGRKWGQLHYAAFNNCVETILALLEYGHDEDSRTVEAETALHIASSNNSHQAVDTLLKNGADPNLLDNASRTPYNVAVENDCTECANLLRDRGASTSARRSAIRAVQKCDDVGLSKLLTSRYTFDDIFKTDCKHPEKCRARTNARSRWSGEFRPRRPVYMAYFVDHFDPLSEAISNDNLDAMRALLQYARNQGVSDLCNRRQCDGLTPIIKLVRSGDSPEALKLLLEYGADVNVADIRGDVALFHSAKYDTKECFELLLESTDREVLDSLSNKGELLLEAVYRNRLTITRMLLHNGFRINVAVPGYYGEKDRPLQVAIWSGNMEMVRMLLDAGASLDFELGCSNEFLSSYDELFLEYTGISGVLRRSTVGNVSGCFETEPRVRSLMHGCRVRIREALMKCGRYSSLYDPVLDIRDLGLPLILQNYILFK